MKKFKLSNAIDWIKTKLRNFWFDVKAKAAGIWSWVEDNPELALVIIPGVLSIAGAIIKKILGLAVSEKRIRDEDKLKNMYIYDRSAGHYWKLRREISNDEYRYIQSRREKGEKYGDILDDLKVLK